MAHLHTLAEAGVHSVGLFTAPVVEIALDQIEDVLALSAEVSDR